MLLKLLALIINPITWLVNFLYHFVALALRWWMVTVFVTSGWLKYKSWDSTVMLFKHEYDVTWFPLPPPLTDRFGFEIADMAPQLAAVLGTSIEIFVPILLLLGVGGRIPALILFIFNYIAAVSYPFLWSDNGLTALKDHYIWGLAIAVLMFKGSGMFSLDHIMRKFCEKYKY